MRKLKATEMARLTPEEYRAAGKMPLIVVLDSVRSLHNVGSVFRTCDAFRVEALWLCGITACPPHAEIHKTALGAEDSVGWERLDSAPLAVSRLRSMGYEVLAVEQCRGSVPLGDFHPEPGKRYAVVLGNEVRGVGQEAIDLCDGCIEIPQFGTKHSLNVSVAAGVVLWRFAERLIPGARARE